MRGGQALTTRALRPAAALGLCALAAAGCSLGPGDPAGEVELSVTRDYGREPLIRESDEIRESDTVMRVLDRAAEVETRFGGGFVQSIDDIAGSGEGGRRRDWFFYVNGIESSVGAAEFELAEGERVWWDYRDWTAAMRVPAVVGSYPEPFVHGFEGERWRTGIECRAGERACEAVGERLGEEGVDAPRLGGTSSAPKETIRVLVGPWDELESDPVASILAAGPGASGVFARFRNDRLELLDERGKVGESLPDGGLVAALRSGESPPTWLVTGTSSAAVFRLAAPLLGDALSDRYAVAAAPGRGSIPIPIGESP